MNTRFITTSIMLGLIFITADIHADIKRSSWSSASSWSSTSGSNYDGQAYIGAAFGKVSHDYTGFEEPNSIELLVGANVSENLAIEASYLNLGDADDEFGLGFTIAVDGFTIGAVGKSQISPELELQAKAGLFFWDVEYSLDGFGSITEGGSDLFYGIGAMFKVSDQVSVGAHYNFYVADGEDFNALQAQVQIAIQ